MDSPIQLFPRIYNLDDFIQRDHPQYHPATKEYSDYWSSIERKCLEGVWGHDSDGEKGGWRYMSGPLFYYTNLTRITLDDEYGNPKVDHPDLRDVEWMLSYGWLAARRFSGFENDKEFTCHRLVEKIEKTGLSSLLPNEKILFKRIEHTIRTKEGGFKRYIDAIEYLYQTFKEPLGRPLYLNDALNFFVLGARGFGKSYFCGNAVIGHEYNFFGKKYYDKDYLEKPSPIEIFVGAAQTAKSSELLSKFEFTQKFLRTGPGSWGGYEDFIPGYFHNHAKGNLLPNNADNPYRHIYEVKEGNEWKVKGTGTKIIHGIYTTENPQAAVGTRPTVMVIEEVGLLANLLTVHGANETCQYRNFKFGSSFYIGTGGNIEKITESKIVFSNAIAYNMVPYRDVFEGRAKKIGFFLPAYYVDSKFKDKLGNTDLQAAWEQEMHEREKRKSASDSSAYDEYIKARPIVPSEMFLAANSNKFPVALLKERYVELEREGCVRSVGYFTYKDKSKKETLWVPDNSLKPIEELNLKSDANKIGGWIIYEHPPDVKPMFRLRRPLYKIVYDPFKDDGSGRSFGSIIIYKGFISDDWIDERSSIQDDIVGEYIGRPNLLEELHEEAIKAALYFGARVLPENNLPDFIRYCRLRGLYHILQPSPYEVISKIIKNPGKKYDVGVTMSIQLKSHSDLLISDILKSPWRANEDGVKEWLYKIKSKRLLLELIHFDGESNYDHISSLRLLALWIKNELEYETSEPKEVESYRKAWNEFADSIEHQKRDPYYVYRTNAGSFSS